MPWDHRHNARPTGARKRGYTTAWDKARKLFLAQHPLCRMCEREGKITAATVVDHIVPHRGDPKLFWDTDNWQPLCQHHHNAEKQRLERLGYMAGCDANGRPRDPLHPWNGGSVRMWGYSIPHGIKPSAIHVHLVCGAPGSGKSTYVEQRAKPGDVVIDMDVILQTLGFQRYTNNPLHVKLALRERDRILCTLGSRATGEAWVIVMAPTQEERDQWVEALGNVTVHPIDATAVQCKRRIMSDPTREGQRDRLVRAVDEYFTKRSEKSGTCSGSPSLAGCVSAAHG